MGRAWGPWACESIEGVHAPSPRSSKFFEGSSLFSGLATLPSAPFGTRPTLSLLLVIDLDFDVGWKRDVLVDRSKGWMLTGGGHCFPNPFQHTSTEAVAGP